jgi:hypothetical protein
MITHKLKDILKSAGCTCIIYESDKLMNLLTDQSDQNDIIGLVIQPNNGIFETQANGIAEHYTLFTIEILKQVKLEDSAENNEDTFHDLYNVCKKVILYMIASEHFKKIIPVPWTKIIETKYDANVIGYAMEFNLYYLHNEGKEPCII